MRITTWGAPRALGALLVLSVLAMMVAAGGSAARTPQAADTEGLVNAEWTPLGLRNGMTTVMVQVAGDPSALVEGNANRELSDAEKASIEGQLKTTQAGVEKAVEQLGGTVLADYQSRVQRHQDPHRPQQDRRVAKAANVVAVRPLAVRAARQREGRPADRCPRSLGRRRRLSTARTSRSPSSTPASTTRTPTSAAPAPCGLRRSATPPTRCRPTRRCSALPRRASRAASTSSATTTTPTRTDPAYQPVPHPDPNPLDCNGHGTHVAGTAAGSGVLANGTTYTGPYNATTISGNIVDVGPGVAPKADLYAIRVFGCDGSTDVTVDAIEWAVDNDMDVINMSLGSSFGTADDPSAVASTNAAKAGVIVVTSAGNSGPNQYITGSPGTADGRASRPRRTTRRRSSRAPRSRSRTGRRSTAINANGYRVQPADHGPTIKVITDNPATRSQTSRSAAPVADYGTDRTGHDRRRRTAARAPASREADLRPAGRRGRRDHGQQRRRRYPPFEGTITGNPDTGEPTTSRSRSSASRASRPRRVRRRQAPRANGQTGDARRRRRSRTRTSRASRTSRRAARGLATAA